jgi:hypothetical protein
MVSVLVLVLATGQLLVPLTTLLILLAMLQVKLVRFAV